MKKTVSGAKRSLQEVGSGWGLGAKILVGGDEIDEGDLLSMTDEAWLTGGCRKGSGGGGDGGYSGDMVPELCRVGAVDGFDCFVACGRSAPEGWAVMGLEYDFGMLVDACIV